MEAAGRAGMLLRDSCHYYHLALRGEGRFLRKTKFPPLGVTEKYVTFFDILRKISTQPPMILAIRGATALLLQKSVNKRKLRFYVKTAIPSQVLIFLSENPTG